MKTLGFKKYYVYVEESKDRKDVMKLAVPARNEDEAMEYVEGNGEVIAIKDVTDRKPISVQKVGCALALYGFGQTEIDLITRTLLVTNIAD